MDAKAAELFIPEETLFELLIRYGLYLAAAFQIFCLACLFLKTGNLDDSVDVSSKKM